ncbi:hypothetical protein R1T16_17540 [Flavobacterium sp. DG1-102-2]|uniref:hypothetical protein n=1 Tax=Flavobacterium sp. DG1-102-2 TaxID=3081663 RepID=UPI002949E6C2|nr:hypothetical protein [Flavobacterium sp. DG1-102-2]MDV6170244.1 hypothetical protein [Flavobacterium sp. DG1-102-2]
MNKTNFVQTGGVPLKAERLQEMQDAYSIFNALANIVGTRAIISGCNLQFGNTISDGVVSLNGEIYEFKGGVVQANVIIVDEPTNVEFQNGQVKPLHHKRYITFGTGLPSYAWSTFKRGKVTSSIQAELDEKAALTALNALIFRVADLEKKTAIFQAGGGMFHWRKPANQIPPGYAEVVDWRGRLAMGWNPDDADFDTLGETGGAKNRTVSVNIPISGYGVGGSADTGDGGKLIVGSGNHENAEFFESLRKASLTPSTSGNVDVLNPYRIVMFIEFIG